MSGAERVLCNRLILSHWWGTVEFVVILLFSIQLGSTVRLRFRKSISGYHFQTIRELSSYHHIGKKIVWKYYHANISIWSPTNSRVKISVLLKGIRICNNICTPVWGFGSYRPVFYSIQFWNIKSQFSLKLLVFLGHVMKRYALPFFGKQVHNKFLEKIPC